MLYNVKNIAIFQEDIYIGSGEQLIVWDKYGKFKRVLSKKGNDPQSYLHFNHFMIWPNGDLSIASPIEIVTYSNSHQFINKKRCENVGYIEAITLLNDSLYIIKCMPTPEQLRYRIINHHTGAIINSYDSIINCNRYISSSQTHLNGMKDILSLMVIKATTSLNALWIVQKYVQNKRR